MSREANTEPATAPADFRMMTADERVLAAFEFFQWLEEHGYEEVKRRFVESGLLDGRRP